MSAPLPCPVCGGTSKAAVVGDGSRCRVFCHTALACLIGPSFPTQAEAVAAWNKLAHAVAALPVLVEALDGLMRSISSDPSGHDAPYCCRHGHPIAECPGEPDDDDGVSGPCPDSEPWKRAYAALALVKGEK